MASTVAPPEYVDGPSVLRRRRKNTGPARYRRPRGSRTLEGERGSSHCTVTPDEARSCEAGPENASPGIRARHCVSEWAATLATSGCANRGVAGTS